MTVAADVRPAWRCEGCGRVSQASHRPQYHWRRGEHCGPFAAATIAPDGAVLAPAPQATDPDPALRYRQSRLRAYLECPRRTVLASPLTTGTVGSSADLGAAAHAVFAENLRTLRRQGERQMATEEAVAIMREVTANGPWILTPTDYNGTRNSDGTQATSGLVQMVCNFAGQRWPSSRFMAIEDRLSREILCPDGEIRLLTGQPDLLIADPGAVPGIICVDHKTGMARPRAPREDPPEGEAIRGVQYLTEGSFAQFAIYAVLVMPEWPRVQRFIGREKSWRWGGPWREVVISRNDVEEHLVRWVGEHMMKLDRGLREGEGSEYAQPRPCSACLHRCPVKRSCGVPAEQRGLGALDSDDAADAEAARLEVIKALHPELRDALKEYVKETGRAPRLPDGRVLRWDGEKPNRKFGAFPPVENGEKLAKAQADAVLAGDFVASMEAELARREQAPVAS